LRLIEKLVQRTVKLTAAPDQAPADTGRLWHALLGHEAVEKRSRDSNVRRCRNAR
jgi:hypothetical protein